MKRLFSKSFIVGAGFGLGLAAVAAIAVTVGTVKTWTSGETLTSSDLNSTISSLKTALEAIPNWTKSGTSAVYSDGNVGIATTSPGFKLTVGSGTIGNVHPDHDLVVTKLAGSARMGAYVNNKGVSLWTGNGNTYGAIYAYDYGAGTGLPLVLNEFGGNVGIGTQTPSARLTVAGGSIGMDNATNINFKNNSGGGGEVLRADQANDIMIGDIFNHFGSRTILWTSGSARVIVGASGNVGIGSSVTAPSQPLQMASGAYVTTGGVWTNASSLEYKENIRDVTAEEALATVMALQPQKFNYKSEGCAVRKPSPLPSPLQGEGVPSPRRGEGKGEESACSPEQYVGFVAEDVPDLVATKDRKGLSAMDIVAVLTKVVQRQEAQIEKLQREVRSLKH